LSAVFRFKTLMNAKKINISSANATSITESRGESIAKEIRKWRIGYLHVADSHGSTCLNQQLIHLLECQYYSVLYQSIYIGARGGGNAIWNLDSKTIITQQQYCRFFILHHIQGPICLT